MGDTCSFWGPLGAYGVGGLGRLGSWALLGQPSVQVMAPFSGPWDAQSAFCLLDLRPSSRAGMGSVAWCRSSPWTHPKGQPWAVESWGPSYLFLGCVAKLWSPSDATSQWQFLVPQCLGIAGSLSGFCFFSFPAPLPALCREGGEVSHCACCFRQHLRARAGTSE